MHQKLDELYKKTFGQSADTISELAGHGSNRHYVRLGHNGKTVLGTLNSDVSENRAFIDLAHHFSQHKLPVPKIIAISEEEDCYLQSDLGDATLFIRLNEIRKNEEAISQEIQSLYSKVVQELPRFQILASKDLDYRICYPRAAFDAQSIQWDLNYFKYYFLRFAEIPFHEQALEDDFTRFINYLIQTPSDFFLYRDFQSRNIMIKDGDPWFIDFQGGRKGPLAYDIASLLLDAKANLPFEFREQILAQYLETAQSILRDTGASSDLIRHTEPAAFRPSYTAFSLIRLLQAMGAYGFRGFHEKKIHFLQSVPYAIRNLSHLLDSWDLPLEMPTLRKLLEEIVEKKPLIQTVTKASPLHLTLTSFSYKKGYPEDHTGHGGGFVFDCRCLPNPGRDPKLAIFTGKDPIIQSWLRQHRQPAEFLSHIQQILTQAIEHYQGRKFNSLSVGFGCTGGRHRSVYCAEKTREWLNTLPGISTQLSHRELEPRSK